jgi:N-acetyltransferase
MLAWVEDALVGQRAGRELPFATYSRAHGRVVGSTRFYELEFWRRSSEDAGRRGQRPNACLIGYTWLAACAQRTACNRAAKLLMLSHAFEAWEVHRVAFRIDSRNERSRSAIERLGARFSGIRRAERLGADGTVRDSAFYSILAAEWPAVKQRPVDRLAPSGSDPARGDPAGLGTSSGALVIDLESAEDDPGAPRSEA